MARLFLFPLDSHLPQSPLAAPQMSVSVCFHPHLYLLIRQYARIYEYALEEGMATHSSILAWRIPMFRGAWRVTVPGVAKSRTQQSD